MYDGKLVIDAYFHTNDASIRGAGPLTKFQRKYHAEKWTHSNFNSKEVGVHVSYIPFDELSILSFSIYEPHHEKTGFLPMLCQCKNKDADQLFSNTGTRIV